MSEAPTQGTRSQYVCESVYSESANAYANCEVCGWPISKHKSRPLVDTTPGPFKPTEAPTSKSESIRELMQRTDSKGQKYSYVNHATLDRWADEVEHLAGLMEKDGIRTREHNILVQENRRLSAALKHARECLLAFADRDHGPTCHEAQQCNHETPSSTAGDSGLTGQGRTPGNVTEAPVRFSSETNTKRCVHEGELRRDFTHGTVVCAYCQMAEIERLRAALTEARHFVVACSKTHHTYQTLQVIDAALTAETGAKS